MIFLLWLWGREPMLRRSIGFGGRSEREKPKSARSDLADLGNCERARTPFWNGVTKTSPNPLHEILKFFYNFFSKISLSFFTPPNTKLISISEISEISTCSNHDASICPSTRGHSTGGASPYFSKCGLYQAK